MKKIAILLILCIPVILSADQITKIAVVDYNQILSIYYKDSDAVRELNQFEEDIKEDVLRRDNEIKELESQLLEARRDGEERKVLTLESQISEKKNILVEFIKVKRSQLQEMKQSLESELTIVDEIAESLQFVAENNGFSMVFRKEDPSVLWYSYDVDITQEVINHLANK